LNGTNHRCPEQVSEKPEVCFIIPTCNRVDALPICLEHLELQTFANFEVIVVDDGSTDATPEFIERFVASTKLRIRAIRQENSGPARARNRAVALTDAPISIIIGDDILCSPQFCATHVDFHRRNPEVRAVGLGLTVWSSSLQTVTPFMRWMDESGAQFAYHDLMRGERPEWRHFYTSNLSLKTQLLRENPFNERFTKACWMMEDMELGYRLEQRDMLRLVLLPEALAEHFHPTDFRKACKRAYAAGLSSRVFRDLWPLRDVGRHGIIHRFARELLSANAWLLPPVTALTEMATRVWCPNPLLKPVLAWHTAVARRRGA
jgi:glycosyltransferase involved in cell wall biosynthesis